MIENLLRYENLEDTNAAVEMLVKGDNGWTHKFKEDVRNDNLKVCAIC